MNILSGGGYENSPAAEGGFIFFGFSKNTPPPDVVYDWSLNLESLRFFSGGGGEGESGFFQKVVLWEGFFPKLHGDLGFFSGTFLGGGAFPHNGFFFLSPPPPVAGKFNHLLPEGEGGGWHAFYHYLAQNSFFSPAAHMYS